MISCPIPMIACSDCIWLIAVGMVGHGAEMADGVRRGRGGTELPPRRAAAVRRPTGDQPADHEPGKGPRCQAFRPEQSFGAAHRRRRGVPGAVPGGARRARERGAAGPQRRHRRIREDQGRLQRRFHHRPPGRPGAGAPAGAPPPRARHRHLPAHPGHPEDAPGPGVGHRAGRRPRHGSGTGADGRSRRRGWASVLQRSPARRGASVPVQALADEHLVLLESAPGWSIRRLVEDALDGPASPRARSRPSPTARRCWRSSVPASGSASRP